MMQNNDLISREALLDIVGKMPLDWEYGKAVSDIYDIIKNAPSVDAVPVVHGRWAFAGLWEECSVCKHPIAVDEPRTNFCPNCGAKMDLEVPDGKT